mmetsp:Transcript_19827/g.22832  ORF Transcript_19827/g.22832 Transcript_19827/m.22832 type:complete len:208 (+) Transcript_19827:114-737(+)
MSSQRSKIHPHSIEAETASSVVKKCYGVKTKNERSIILPSPRLQGCCSNKARIETNEDYFRVNDKSGSILKTKRRNLHVSFGDLEVREYNLTLTDHPGTSFGPPIGLSWDHGSAETFDLEVYESYRMLYSPRRLGNELKLSDHTRRKILLNELNFSREEIEKACSDATRIQKQRISSQSRIALEPVEVAIESLKRKVTRIIKKPHSQ